MLCSLLCDAVLQEKPPPIRRHFLLRLIMRVHAVDSILIRAIR
jgi:hypothetical protein